MPFCIHGRFTFDLCSWCLALVFILCTTELGCKLSRILKVNIINENIYSHGTGRISGFLINLYRNISHFLPIIIINLLWSRISPGKIPYFISESMNNVQS
jgi:hypothetical protein